MVDEWSGLLEALTPSSATGRVSYGSSRLVQLLRPRSGLLSHAHPHVCTQVTVGGWRLGVVLVVDTVGKVQRRGRARATRRECLLLPPYKLHDDTVATAPAEAAHCGYEHVMTGKHRCLAHRRPRSTSCLPWRPSRRGATWVSWRCLWEGRRTVLCRTATPSAERQEQAVEPTRLVLNARSLCLQSAGISYGQQLPVQHVDNRVGGERSSRLRERSVSPLRPRTQTPPQTSTALHGICLFNLRIPPLTLCTSFRHHLQSRTAAARVSRPTSCAPVRQLPYGWLTRAWSNR